MNDVLTLLQAAAEYRRLADSCDEPGERDAYLHLALVLEIALHRLGAISATSDDASEWDTG
jgi:hypothetical protein